MSSDSKGAEPSIEEILASIRRIIADSTSPTPNTIATSHVPPPLNSPQLIDDGEAFELPAMFRSPHSHAHHLPPQIGDIDLDGHRIDWQQRPENRGRERREASFEQPPAGLEQGVRAQEFDAGAELQATSWARVPDTAESEPSVSVSERSSGNIDHNSAAPPILATIDSGRRSASDGCLQGHACCRRHGAITGRNALRCFDKRCASTADTGRWPQLRTDHSGGVPCAGSPAERRQDWRPV